MKRVATALVLIPLVIVILFKAPFPVFASVVFTVAILAAREYLHLAEATNLFPLLPSSFFLLSVYIILRACSGVPLSWGPWRHTDIWATIVSSLSPLLLLVAAMITRELPRVLPSAGSSFLVIPYVGMTLSDLFFIRRHNGGALLIMFFFLIIWIGDAGAYYVGRQLGKHKLAPTISPNKTWEGAAASFIGAVVTGLLLFHFVEPISNGLVRLHLMESQPVMNVESGFHSPLPWLGTALFAAGINVAAQMGDLLESAMKRGAGVKDSGTLLPGHGGILDRIDALLLALPVLWYYAIFLLNHQLWFLP